MSKSNSKNSFLVQGTILAIASVMVRFIGILYRIPLQSLLGDEGMGYYSTAYEIYSVLLILSSYSLPTAISKLVSTRIAKKEYQNAYRVFIGGIIFALISGTIVALITFFYSNQLAALFKLPESAMALKALTPTLFLVAVMGVLRGFFQGFGTMMPTAISQIIEKVVQVATSLVFCVVMLSSMTKKAVEDSSVIPEAYGACGATLGNAFGALLCLAFLLLVFYAFWPALNRKRHSLRFNTGVTEDYITIFKVLILTIIPVLLSTTVNNISSFCDNLITGNILNAQGMAQSDIASLLGILSNKYRTFIMLPVSVASALAVSTMPSMSAAIAVGDRRQAMNKISSSIRFIYAFAAPCAAGVMILANPILQLVYYDGTGGGNAVGTYLLWIGSVTIILSSLVSITNAILQGLGHLNIPVIHCAIALAAHIVSAVILMGVFRLGIYSIVIAEIILALTTLILNYRYLYAHYDYHQELRKTFLLPSVCTVIMAFATSITYYLLRIVTHSRVMLVLLPMIVAVIIYVVAMILLKAVTREDIAGFPKGQLLLRIFTKLHLM